MDMTEPYAHIQKHIERLELDIIKSIERKRIAQAEIEICQGLLSDLKAALKDQIEADKARGGEHE